MAIASSIDNDFILLNHPGGEREALFREINQLLSDKGYVEETYLQALINREENNPTAMQLEKIGVAIPHVDVEHIKEEKLVVVSCPEGIEFKQAEDPDEKDAHIDFLMKLIGLFRQTEKMDTFLTTQSPEEVKKLLTAALN